MCGICGIAYRDPRRSPRTEDLETMMDSMVHRGPDDSGVLVESTVGLGFRRLAIIDLVGGNQPITNEDSKVAVIMNGEVYNFRELRSSLAAKGHVLKTGSDAEVLVHLYEEKGTDLVDDLVGMFAFSIVDLRGPRPVVVLGRDRLGIKPLYYAENEGSLIWASEVKAILGLGDHSKELRPEALLTYLIRGCVGGEQSAWQGIRRLPPATILTWDSESTSSTRQYWDLPTSGLRESASSLEIVRCLDEAVSDRLVSDVPLGAFLSGGMDSSAVVASMAQSTDDQVITCTVGFHEKSRDEVAVARNTARALGARHYFERVEADPRIAVEVLPWFFDEPHADPSNVPTFLVSRMARERVTVAMSGDGGDETFGGYRRYIHDVAENRLRNAVGARGQRWIGALAAGYPKLDWAPRIFRAKTFLLNVGSEAARAYWRSVTQVDRADALALLEPDLARQLEAYDPFYEFESHYLRPKTSDSLYRAQYADFHTYLPDLILTKVDRASMANSLEVRVPILDHRFCGRFANLPSREKIRRGRGKHAFREALRSRVPHSVLDGTKRGFFIPLKRWIGGPLSPAVSDAVHSLPEEWFQRRALQSVLTQHQSGEVDHSRLLWSLLVLEHWRRRHEVRGLADS